MKLLTRAYATYAEADLDGGFCPPHFALIDLEEAETRESLRNLCALVNTVAQAQPIFSADSKEEEALHLVFDVLGEPAEFFNDHKGKRIGDFVQSAATSVYVAPPLKSGANYCLVPDNFTLEVDEDEGSCAVEGGDGPVCCATDTELMVATDGFWFTTSLEYFSAKLKTAVIPWSLLETVSVRSTL